MATGREQSNLPSKKRQCPKCKSEKLSLKKEVINRDTIYEKIQTRIECGECLYIIGFVH